MPETTAPCVFLALVIKINALDPKEISQICVQCTAVKLHLSSHFWAALMYRQRKKGVTGIRAVIWLLCTPLHIDFQLHTPPQYTKQSGMQSLITDSVRRRRQMPKRRVQVQKTAPPPQKQLSGQLQLEFKRQHTCSIEVSSGSYFSFSHLSGRASYLLVGNEARARF